MSDDADRVALTLLAGAKPGPGELESGRPQDQGRSHKRRGRPSAETTSLLASYQAAMRDELRSVLVELAGTPPPPGLDLDGKPPAPVRPKLDVRMRLWDLAIKLGRELGTAVDVEPTIVGAVTQGPRKRSRSRIDYGPDR